jgi:hypothetical protein
VTKENLQKSFSLYLDEIDKCVEAKCYWALLHVLLTIPDICGSLLERKNNGVQERYMKWIKSYYHPEKSGITPSDLFQMRNSLLHNGSTTVNYRKSNYCHFSFVNPDAFDLNIHHHIDDGLQKDDEHSYSGNGRRNEKSSGFLVQFTSE